MFEMLKRNFKGFIDRMAKTELDVEKLDKILWEFKLALLENDVGMVVADHICDEIKNRLRGRQVRRFEDRRVIVKEALREALLEILKTERIDLIKAINDKRSKDEPFIIVFVGVNGTGKTTTIAKVAYLLMKHEFTVVLACSDTFRAGSIEQLEEHARNLGVRTIKHRYGADPAAVAYDAIQHAKAHGIDVVLIDTAGRMQTNKNLMQEMEKIVRVVKPDLVIFVGDALTGNDAVEQAEEFSKYIRIDCSILTKVDADAKGGSAISISHITGKPILFIGTGQKYEDLEPFNPETIINRIVENEF